MNNALAHRAERHHTPALVVVGVAALAVVGVACSSGSDKKGGQAAPSASVGQAVRDGKFEFTVNNVNCGAARVGGDVTGETAQGQFCLVNLTVKNIGDQAQMLDASSQLGYSADGSKYDANSMASIAANEGTQTFLNNINPGNQVTGTVAFDVPKDKTLTKVELHDSPASGGVTVQVS